MIARDPYEEGGDDGIAIILPWMAANHTVYIMLAMSVGKVVLFPTHF